MENERIRAIYDASVDLFLNQGYSRTQISHIAKAVGVSVGTIYHDFTGKREIMHFILKSTIDPEFISREFERPITDALFDGLETEIIAVFDETADAFAENLEAAGVSYPLEQMVSDAFDLMAKYAVGCLFIEKNELDCRNLARYYRTYRKQFFITMAEYLKRYMEKGIVRPLKSVELTTGLMIEMLSWWAMDMRFITFEAPNITLEQAKEVCLDNIISAYGI